MYFRQKEILRRLFTSRQPVKGTRGLAEELRFFRSTCAGGQALERVPVDGVAAGQFVDGEIALEHRALGPENLDARLDGGFPGFRQFFRRRRFGL